MPKSELSTIYLDESGNTGSDLLSVSDPFFVYAWVLLSREQELAIEGAVKEVLSNEHLDKGSELHSVKLWQSRRGCERWQEVLKTVHKAGGTIFLSFTEKVFEACVFMVEAYLDPNYNLEMTEKRYWDVEFKRLLADAIMETVPRGLLGEFIKACNSDDLPALKEIGLRISRFLALHSNKGISAASKYFEAGSANPYRYGERTEGAPSGLFVLNNHITAFSLPLVYVNEELNVFQTKAALVRDQDFRFGSVLDLAFKTVGEISHGLDNIISCSEDSSAKRTGLQVADLAAGIASRVLRARYRKHPLKPYQWDIWHTLKGSLPRGKWSYQLTSSECEKKLDSLWDDPPDESWYEAKLEASGDSPPSCSCGERIPSGKMRDFYLHVLAAHPDSCVMGTRCGICKELVPFGLLSCHHVIEHGITPPAPGSFYGDLQKDLEVLRQTRAKAVRVVEPS